MAYTVILKSRSQRLSRPFEQEVADLLRGVPGWRVLGVDSPHRKPDGTSRRIDVIAEHKVGKGVSFLVFVECKHWKRRLDLDRFASFMLTVQQAGASLGMVVSTSGFQRGVRDLAGHYPNIGLFTWEDFQSFVLSAGGQPPQVAASEPSEVRHEEGKAYFLHSKDVTLRGGRMLTVYYFAGKEGPGALDNMPPGYIVVESSKGLPFVVRGANEGTCHVDNAQADLYAGEYK